MNGRRGDFAQGRPSVSSDTHDNTGKFDIASSRVTRLKQIKIDETDLTYAEQGKGEPIIFIHGALGDYRTWSQQLDWFSRQYHAISYSRRFHRPNAPCGDAISYTYRRHIDDLIAVLDVLRIGPAHLVGHSYGGTVAAILAMECPEMVRSLTLAEPSLFPMLSSADDKVSLRFHRVALNVVQKLAENGEERLAVREYVNIVLGRNGYDYLPLEALLVIVQNAHTLAPMLRMFFGLSFDPTAIQTLNIPTLVITGENSPKVYHAISHEIHNSLPKSELVTLAGASHGLHMENPRDFNNALLEFLSKNQPRNQNSANSLISNES